LKLANLSRAAQRPIVAYHIVIDEHVYHLTAVVPVMLENRYPYYFGELNFLT
jgi:hypothetical protein